MVSRGLFFAALLAMCGTAQAAVITKTSDLSGTDNLLTPFNFQVMPANIPATLNTPVAGSLDHLLVANANINGQGTNDGLSSVSGASAVQDTIRISGNTIKMYVSAYDNVANYVSGGDINSMTYLSTFTMYYSINGGATVTIGTYTNAQVLASTPFIFLDNMADGSYTIRVWSQVNAKSNTQVVGTDAIGTKPLATEIAADNTDAAASPLTLTVVVDTTKPVTTITTAMSAYSNAATGTIAFTCSKAVDLNLSGGFIEFWTSFAGSAYALHQTVNAANGENSGSYPYTLAGQTDGSYTFSVYCKWIGNAKTDKNFRAVGDTRDNQNGLGGYVETTTPKPSLTWFYDTTAPAVAVQAGPGVGGAASLFAYGAGTTSFTFSCTDENGLACTYKCALDGKATSNGASTSTASKGYYSCTSGHTITLAAGVTTTFHVYAVDLAGNESPLSPMYAYSNDNTAPLVAFGKADTGATGAVGAYQDVITLATQATNADESFGGYYPTTIDAANGEFLKDGSTAVKSYLQSTPTGTVTANPIDTLNVVTAATTTSQATYRTVLQVAMDNTDPVYDLTSNGSRGVTDGYGVLLAAREVNAAKVGTLDYGVYTYNVLLSTNSPGGKLDFVCIHNEMLNGDSIGDIITAA